MIHRIANELVSFAIDGKANLVELKNLKTGRDYAGGQGLWRVIYSHDEVIEEEILSEACQAKISTPAKDILRVECEAMRDIAGREIAFSFAFEARLNGDCVELSAELANNAKPGRTIRELNFPSVKNLQLAKDQSLYIGVEKIDDIPGAIQRQDSGYVAEDNCGINLPFFSAGFGVIANKEDGLYLGDHDPSFELTAHLFRKRGSQIDAAIHKSPFLGAGESRKYTGFALSPYAGDWHIGAKKFRKWADSWCKIAPRPPSIANGFKGWYRLIFRHQYGKILFRHDEMPRILKSMKETGIDTLFIFGWWREGMDAGYPDYAYDEAQGGKAALKEHFRQFRANGGKIILYFNGRLIDTATDYYRKHGQEVSILGPDKQPLIDRYMFAGPGIDLRHQFGNKSFALACPHSKEWMEILKGHIDKAIELGVDGVFFDQLGFAERPCFAENHGHPAPMLDGRAKRMSQLKTLREYLHSKRPEMSFGIECVASFTGGFVDFIHSYPGWNSAKNDWLGKGEKPKLAQFIELFRYTFPEVLISDREIRDDTDIERRVNLAVLRGLVSDVETHRCRTLIDEGAPHYKQYLAKANKLRERFRRLILNGLFQDTDGASCDNEEISWSVFKAGDELAVIATQSHLEEAKAQFKVPGYVFAESGALGEAEVSGGKEKASAKLKRHALAVMAFKKA